MIVIPIESRPDAPRRLLVEADGVRVEAFTFASGIEALDIDAGALNLVVLPFRGQQVWRARAFGRDLTMRSTFEDPVASDDYLEGNGAYFIHCGGSAMGNPGPTDAHPLHGELPSARLEECALELDPAEGALTVRGRMTRRVSFGPYFSAELALRIRRDDPVMVSTARITNRSAEPRPLMYLAHINMRPAIGGRIDEQLQPGRAPITRAELSLTSAGEVRQLSAQEFDASGLSLTDLLAPGVRVEPELVQTVPSARVDGIVTVRQVHSTGEVDVVSFGGDDLTHTIRWLRRSADDDAFGFALPATAEADGFDAESAKGHVRWYEPGESLVATIRHGAERPGEPAGHPLERNQNAD